MTTPYVAPARRVLTRLHRPDPAGATDPAAPDPVEGHTRCGLPMLASELWQPVDGKDGETLCTGCLLPGAAVGEPAITEEAMF